VNNGLVIAIDGPAGSGKSTVSKRVAQELDYLYIDTGAMYRALTLKAMREKVSLENEKALVRLCDNADIELSMDEEGSLKVTLDGEDVSREIRDPEVTNNVFYIAKLPEVRKHMVSLQRKAGEKQNAVLEGRDIGTVVFPDADFKFYIDADFQERVRRRFVELKEEEHPVSMEEVSEDLKIRDEKDKTRKVAPLKKAEDARYIDTTNMTIEQVVDEVIKQVRGSS
jgi:cytidylate kinase